MVRRERDDLGQRLQGAETEASNAEAAKKRMVQRKQKELDVAVAEVNRRRDTERDLRVKIKDLSTEAGSGHSFLFQLTLRIFEVSGGIAFEDSRKTFERLKMSLN